MPMCQCQCQSVPMPLIRVQISGIRTEWPLLVPHILFQRGDSLKRHMTSCLRMIQNLSIIIIARVSGRANIIFNWAWINNSPRGVSHERSCSQSFQNIWLLVYFSRLLGKFEILSVQFSVCQLYLAKRFRFANKTSNSSLNVLTPLHLTS